MKNRIKGFWTDYKAIQKESVAFWKKHWIGMTICTIGAYGLGCGIGLLIDYIHTGIEVKKLEKDLDKKIEQSDIHMSWQNINF